MSWLIATLAGDVDAALATITTTTRAAGLERRGSTRTLPLMTTR